MAWNGTAAEWENVVGEELYDHTGDTGEGTTVATSSVLYCAGCYPITLRGVQGMISVSSPRRWSLLLHCTGFLPDNYENVNVANDTKYASIKQKHVNALALGWRSALPPQ